MDDGPPAAPSECSLCDAQHGKDECPAAKGTPFEILFHKQRAADLEQRLHAQAQENRDLARRLAQAEELVSELRADNEYWRAQCSQPASRREG